MTSLTFSVEATDDNVVDSGETVIATLTAPTVSNGTASLVAGKDVATATIVDVDSAVTFKIEVTSEAAGNDVPTQAATLKEEDNSDDLASFTVTLGGSLVLGETASVTVTGSGTAGAGDYSPALAAAIQRRFCCCRSAMG